MDRPYRPDILRLVAARAAIAVLAVGVLVSYGSEATHSHETGRAPVDCAVCNIAKQPGLQTVPDAEREPANRIVVVPRLALEGRALEAPVPLPYNSRAPPA